jgi:hypothetical protein
MIALTRCECKKLSQGKYKKKEEIGSLVFLIDMKTKLRALFIPYGRREAFDRNRVATTTRMVARASSGHK